MIQWPSAWKMEPNNTWPIGISVELRVVTSAMVLPSCSFGVFNWVKVIHMMFIMAISTEKKNPMHVNTMKFLEWNLFGYKCSQDGTYNHANTDASFADTVKAIADMDISMEPSWWWNI